MGRLIRPVPFLRRASIHHCAGIIAMMALPAVVHTPYVLHLLTIYYVYLILSVGLSIVVGYAGLLDLGYIAFFAIGAYTHAILSTAFHCPFWLSTVCGGSLAAGLGVLLGFPTLRVRGDYLALVTLAFGEMVRMLMLNLSSITQGPKGIAGIASPALGSHQMAQPSEYYYLAAVGLVVAITVFWRIVSSRPGLVWEAIRDEETAARTCGLNSVKWLLLAFACGATFAGVAGALFAAIQRFISPDSFVLDESVLVMSIVVLAGGRSVPRMFVAAAVLCLAPEFLRELQQYRSLVFGALLVVFTIVENRLSFLGTRFPSVAAMTNEGGATAELDADGVSLLHSAATASALRVQNASKSFMGVTALAGVSFVKHLRGKCIALIGTNGAGKTTLFDCISGVQGLDGGSIVLEGVGRIDNLGPDVIARLGVGRTYQTVRLFSSMTVLGNVLVGGLCKRSIGRRTKTTHPDKQMAMKVAVAALRFVGIEAYQDEQATSLPIGLQRKVELARALALRPVVLLLDEPASGLNEAEKGELSATLRRIIDHLDIPIVLVEHDMASVSRLADDVVVLDHGRVIAEGSPQSVLSDELVIGAYLGTGGRFDAVNA